MARGDDGRIDIARSIGARRVGTGAEIEVQRLGAAQDIDRAAIGNAARRQPGERGLDVPVLDHPRQRRQLTEDVAT